MNRSSLVRKKTYSCSFVKKTSQVQALSLGLIIKQAKLKYNNVFVNKLVNMRVRFNYIYYYIFMYILGLKIYLYKLEIKLYKFVNRFIRY